MKFQAGEPTPSIADSARDRLVDALRSHGSRVVERGDSAVAQCPAHEDRNPSLSVRGIEGQVLVYCHGGCDTDSVLAALDLTRRDLFDSRNGATYRYDDGRIVRRSPDKRFFQQNVTTIPELYRRAAVVAAVDADRPVYLVEGEKDVHALEAVGVVATTAPQGAQSIGKADLSPLHGGNITVVVDADAAGARWAQTVAERLDGMVQSVRFVQAATGKDAADHIAAGHTLEDWTPYVVPEDRQEAEGEVRHTLAGRMLSGGAFVLDTPARVPAVWGAGSDVLWSEGEALILAGPPGVGKTTLTGQVVRGLLGLQDQVLGYPVAPAARKVLYLAMDRPRQIARSLARHFTQDERQALDEGLVVWPGPPPADLARMPELLLDLATEAGASHVIIDSLKDAAVGLTEDEVGAMYNRARQTALAAGVEVLELHHVVKRGPNGARPSTLADLYGSVWITSGAGSVVLLWGAAGDPIVDLHHLKQPAEPVGPLRVIHDHEHGISQVWQSTDPLVVLRLAGEAGVSAQRLAAAMFETDKPDRNQTEKARRKLTNLVRDGLAESLEGAAPAGGGKPQVTYRAITQPITRVIEDGAITDDTSNHDPDKTAGQTITQPITAITQGSNHDPHHPFKGVGSVADACPDCGEPLNHPGFTSRCRPNHQDERTN